MKRNVKVFAMILTMVLCFILPNMQAYAGNVASVTATGSDSAIAVEGKAEAGVLAVAVLVYDKDNNLVTMGSAQVNDDKSFAIAFDVANGSYTVKVADYEGGAYKTATVEAKETASSETEEKKDDEKKDDEKKDDEKKDETKVETEKKTTETKDNKAQLTAKVTVTSEDVQANSTGAVELKKEAVEVIVEEIKEVLKEVEALVKAKGQDKVAVPKVELSLGKATVLPVEVLETMKGNDMDIVLNMEGYSWTINGGSIDGKNLKDINLEVKSDVKVIKEDKVKALAGDKQTKQISLTHDGEFGFDATLTIPLGTENKGKYGNLYWLKDGELVFMNSGAIGEDGQADLAFSHASDYLIVIGEDMTPAKNQTTGGSEGSATTSTATTSTATTNNAKTGDNSGLSIVLFMLCLALAMGVLAKGIRSSVK